VAGVDHPEWDWEKTDPARSGSSGDIAKFFKNEGTKNPGILARGAPADAATLTAREVIQNSWDAARELQATMRERGEFPPHFEIEFEFTDLVGQAKRDLMGRLELESIHRRLEDLESDDPKARAAVGLPAVSALDQLDGDVPLRILRIKEKGASGMYGPFVGDRSKLYLALVSIGYTQKAEGSGGSYGYGKAGLIGASAIRTVVAYTCFQSQRSEPGVTRRLLGMTYWGQHSIDGDSYTGFSRFGHLHDGWTHPFDDDRADDDAQGLGFELRNAAIPSDLGTTFLVIDPVITPEDLMTAIERNWWPAIEDREFVAYATINHADGTTTRIDANPRRDPVIDSFVSAWNLATMPQDAPQSTKLRKSLGKHAGTELGVLGLTAKPDGWSYAQVETVVDPDGDDEDSGPVAGQSSLVALVRGPKMVVEYLVVNRGKTPFLRGVFVADDSVDDLLRQTEPKAHDSWQTTSKDVGDGVDGTAPKIAKEVLLRIKREVREMQKRLKPPPPAPEDIDLPEFQKLFRTLMAGGGKGPNPKPPKGDRDVSLRFVRRRLVTAAGDRVSLDAKVAFKLSEHFTDGDSAECVIQFDYSFVEDGRKGASCDLRIMPPVGFTESDGRRFIGTLGREEVVFEVTSDPYSSDWTARLSATGRIAKAAIGGTA